VGGDRQTVTVVASKLQVLTVLFYMLLQVYMKSTDKQPKRHLMQFENAAAAAAAAAAAGASESAAAAAANGVAAAVSAPALFSDDLIVLVPAAPAAAASCDSDSSDGTSSSSSSGSQRPAVPWVFSEQYRQLTGDFHHPDLLT
jgi:hypothetical protein